MVKILISPNLSAPTAYRSAGDIELPSENWRSGLKDLTFKNFWTTRLDGFLTIFKRQKNDAAAWKGLNWAQEKLAK